MKKPKHAAQSAKTGASSATDKGAHTETQDALNFLRNDTTHIDTLFDKFETAQHQQAQAQAVKELSCALADHVRLMEDVVYPDLRLHGVDEDKLERAQVRLDGIKMLINDIAAQQPGSPYFNAKIAVLAETMKQHAGEQHTDEFFAAARKAGADMDALGRRLQERKHELTEKAERNRLEPLQTRSLGLSHQQEKSMAQGRYGQGGRRERYQDDDDDYGTYSQGGGQRRASGGQDYYGQQYRSGRQDYGDDDYQSQQRYGGGRSRQSDYGSEGYGQGGQSGRRGQYGQSGQYEQYGHSGQSGRYEQSEDYGHGQGRYGRGQQDYGYGGQGYRGERYGRTDEYRQTRGGMQRGQGDWQNEDQERYGEGRSSSERYGYDEDSQRYGSPYRERSGQGGYEGGSQRGYRQTGYEDDYDDRRARSRSRTQDDDTNQTRRGRNGGSRVSTF